MELYEAVRQKLSPRRFKHTLGVVEAAEQLALANQVSTEQARLAALLHDYARELNPGELRTLALETGITDQSLLRQPELLHAPVGALLVKRELGIDDEQVLDAIVSHTVGGRSMSKLAQIIYLADMIEPNRSYPGVQELREAAYADLKNGIILALEHTIKYLLAEKKPINVNTIEARNYLILGGE